MGELPAHHFFQVAKFIRQGTVVPFLGAGANLCERQQHDRFRPGQFLPSGRELARFLRSEWGYPDEGDADLSRVSQFVAVTVGPGELYSQLHEVFDFDYQPTILHRFLARIPALLRHAGQERYQLILTTNYDDALERAFQEASEPYDLLVYMEGGQGGRCRHIAPDGTSTIVERPNEYHAVSPDYRTVIVKIHGAVDRQGAGDNDSYVITEDHYIDYLSTVAAVEDFLPTQVAAKLKGKHTHFLFLGYALRDWNLRVILRRVWGSQKLQDKSWAVLERADHIDLEWWKKQGDVDILEVSLGEYVPRLLAELSGSLEVQAEVRG